MIPSTIALVTRLAISYPCINIYFYFLQLVKMSRVAAIVSTRWLKTQLAEGVKKIKLLDASWNLEHTGPELYAR